MRESTAGQKPDRKQTRHRWDNTAWPNRECTCTRCGLRRRRYGIGRDSYYGFLYPGEDYEEFSPRVPPCEPAPNESET